MFAQVSLLLCFHGVKVRFGGHEAGTSCAIDLSISRSMHQVREEVSVLQSGLLLSEGNTLNRDSVLVFFDPGLYKSMKLKHMKNKAHWDCQGLNHLTVFKIFVIGGDHEGKGYSLKQCHFSRTRFTF